MANFGSRRGFADKLSLPLMILAFLVVIGINEIGKRVEGRTTADQVDEIEATWPED